MNISHATMRLQPQCNEPRTSLASRRIILARVDAMRARWPVAAVVAVGATAWHSTHPGTRDRIAILDDMQAAHRQRMRDTTGRSRALADLVPSTLTSGSNVLDAAGSLWSMLPSAAQRAVLVHALWQGAVPRLTYIVQCTHSPLQTCTPFTGASALCVT
jgi:hypothetical protein